jgi:hypothetical protein
VIKQPQNQQGFRDGDMTKLKTSRLIVHEGNLLDPEPLLLVELLLLLEDPLVKELESNL